LLPLNIRTKRQQERAELRANATPEDLAALGAIERKEDGLPETLDAERFDDFDCRPSSNVDRGHVMSEELKRAGEAALAKRAVILAKRQAADEGVCPNTAEAEEAKASPAP
jgi:hypothetical protein